MDFDKIIEEYSSAESKRLSKMALSQAADAAANKVGEYSAGDAARRLIDSPGARERLAETLAPLIAESCRQRLASIVTGQIKVWASTNITQEMWDNPQGHKPANSVRTSVSGMAAIVAGQVS